MRRVEWLAVFDDSVPREKILSKNLARMTIYPLDPDSVDFGAIRRLLSGMDEWMAPEDYVLIIDEINRGNIAKILGELITLLEPDKRLGAENEMQVLLPYSQKLFGVPSNVHIIGTMNTADRSIAFMDTALRRRFVFEEMMPDTKVVRDHVGSGGVVAGVDVASLLSSMNLRIEYLFDRDHQIGHSYFLKVETLADLRDVFIDRMIPLLQEYFHEDWEKLCVVLSCSYDPDASKPTTANAHPVIQAATFDIAAAGFQDDELDGRLSYSVSQEFRHASEDQLAKFFMGMIP